MKNYYEILEINENASPEEIKKAYRKLATKWHPDKFATKSLEERLKSTEKMQELNEAYGVLGNEELRKRYDSGVSESDFIFEEASESSYEEELSNIQDELEKLKEEEKILARKDVINMIKFEMLITEIYSYQLDSNLWFPYSRWQEKVWKIPIKSSPRGRESIDTSELDKFHEKMINAIRKRKEEWDAGINNPYVDKTRIDAIESIERELSEKKLSAKDLGEYTDYQEQINSLPKVWIIISYRDKVNHYIRSLNSKSENDSQNLSQINRGQNSFKGDNEEKIELTKKTIEPINPNSSNNDIAVAAATVGVIATGVVGAVVITKKRKEKKQLE